MTFAPVMAVLNRNGTSHFVRLPITYADIVSRTNSSDLPAASDEPRNRPNPLPAAPALPVPGFDAQSTNVPENRSHLVSDAPKIDFATRLFLADAAPHAQTQADPATAAKTAP
ncbi:hypothetical protein CLV88_102403 [Shimia abyssi]|uniref:Uncharacterized protein n=1 Tax=Shimia abyssi TaxID=1662395 RepID=A0A2P8FHS5_9RHOB|nr:hypothetical protein [Shimia abyssi]PSL21283.1 hypothetical protein CLV88_102403 [Shimia abyssi]